MSDVIYYKGLTCECDSSVPRLTIEGRQVRVEIVDGLFHSAEPPKKKTTTLRELAEKVVDDSPELKSRERAQKEHLAILDSGVEQWNDWRRRYPEIRPMLYDTNLSSEPLRRDLSDINFANAVLINANLRWARLSGANFHEANLGKADLSWADLTGANFCTTDLYGTNLFHADLTNANLQGTQLAGTIFEGATLKNCTIYGLSAWDLRLDGARQENLIVLYRMEKSAPAGEPEESKIIMPNLQSAQFIYLLLHNEKVHDAFNGLTEKIVLILGRFGGGGLEELLRPLGEGLRKHGYVPMIFEFVRPQDRTFTETIQTLAGLARFVVVDLSGPSVPQELYATVPHLEIPFVPILKKGSQEYSLFADLLGKDWVLKPPVEFESTADLLLMLPDKIISPAEKRVEARRAKLGDSHPASTLSANR